MKIRQGEGNTMELWMRVGQPIEALLGIHERVFAAWAEGGVRGLVIGRMVFLPDAGPRTEADAIPAFEPNRAIYRSLDVEPPASPRAKFPDRRRQLDQLLDAARARNWPVLIFEPAAFAGPGGGGSALLDPVTQRAYLARAQDTLEAFPQVDGAIIDGPEWPYEIAPDGGAGGPFATGHGDRQNMLADLPPAAREQSAKLGYDFTALNEAQRRLGERLRGLTERRVDELATGGLVGGIALLGYDAGVVDWLRFRVDVLTAFVRALREHLNGLGRPVSLGMGPRTASFAPLAGYDFGQLATLLDYLLPKHYFWHRGFDGMYGTTARYVETLVKWNPGLSERSAFAVVRALLGVQILGVESLGALDEGYPPSFFHGYVTDQTSRAIAAVGDADRVVPWVDVGRLPHAGDPIGAGDLRRILSAAASVGMTRFLYHNHAHLSRAEWMVISEMCGQKWAGAGATDYSPPDGLHVSPRSV
jgi:hypothetical protein